jgi:hypothetical protein
MCGIIHTLRSNTAELSIHRRGGNPRKPGVLKRDKPLEDREAYYELTGERTRSKGPKGREGLKRQRDGLPFRRPIRRFPRPRPFRPLGLFGPFGLVLGFVFVLGRPYQPNSRPKLNPWTSNWSLSSTSTTRLTTFPGFVGSKIDWVFTFPAAVAIRSAKRTS